MRDRKKKIRRNRFSILVCVFLWIVAICTIVDLIFSFALPQDLSRTTPIYSRLVQIAFFGQVLIFHISLLLAAVSAIAFLLRRRRLFVLSFVVALVGFVLPLHLRLPGHPPMTVDPRLSVMSMNLKYAHANSELFVDQIRKFNPDVVLLQDFTPFAESALNQSLGSDYPYRDLHTDPALGIAIYSRHPFVGGPPQTISTAARRQMRAVLSVDGKPIVIYIEHPYSPRTRQRIIDNRLGTLELATQLRTETDPVIVAGDFNFTDETATANALHGAGLSDAFDDVGNGRGSTWPASPRWLAWLPGFRIDHIYRSRQLRCRWFSVGDYDGSDHLPIVADVGIWRTR